MATDRLYSPNDVVDGRFVLKERLGKGAFGTVWRATNREDGSTVAIKLLFEKYRRDRKMLARFVQEAKIQERLTHPGIARSLSWSVDAEVVYLSMEYIQGETLDQRCDVRSKESNPIPKQAITFICEQLGAALAHAHQHNVVHRDLKPRNVMINRPKSRPFVKVLDFGIAKILVGSELDPTTVGRVLGSVLYISPEQVFSQPIDHRADIFSLATIMFELITLRRTWAREPSGAPHPFHVPIPNNEHNSHMAVLKRIAREKRPHAVEFRNDISAKVDDVLHRALSIRPEDRYNSAMEFAQALRAALVEPPLQMVPNVEIGTSDTMPEGPNARRLHQIPSGQTPTPRIPPSPPDPSEILEETPTHAMPKPILRPNDLFPQTTPTPTVPQSLEITDASTITAPAKSISTPAKPVSPPAVKYEPPKSHRLLVAALLGIAAMTGAVLYLLMDAVGW